MKTGDVGLKDLDYEYKLWKNRLDCYISEIQIIKVRNNDVAETKPGKELNSVEMMVLEEHESQLNQLLNRIKVQEQEMQFYNKDFPVTHAHEYMLEHQKIRGKMDRLCTIHLERVDDLINELGV
jgi:hypothetical protein